MPGKQYVLQEIQKIGKNSVEVEYSASGATGVERTVYNDFLTREDEKAVVSEMTGVINSSPVVEMHERVRVGVGVVKETLVLGVSPQYRMIRNLLLIDGRFFDEIDDSADIKCAVVTDLFASERFGNANAAIGQSIEIIGVPFYIIGVF